MARATENAPKKLPAARVFIDLVSVLFASIEPYAPQGITKNP